MIVQDLDFLRPLIAPPEYDPPLIVYSDRMLAGEIPSQGFQAVTRRTLTAYGMGGVIVLAVLNGLAWKAGTPRLHAINVFSAGFALGVLGTYISAWPNGYRRIT